MPRVLRYILYNNGILGIHSASTAVAGDKPGVRKEGELLEDVSFLRKTPGIHLMEKLNKFKD